MCITRSKEKRPALRWPCSADLGSNNRSPHHKKAINMDDTKSVASSPLVHAIKLAKCGFEVFPCHGVTAAGCDCGGQDCHNPGKHPIGAAAPAGFKSATSDISQISEWWTEYPTANIGIRPPKGVFVLDFDDAAEVEAYDLPETPSAKSGRPGGGFHVWLKGDYLNTGNLCDTHIQIRGHNGYVIGPPSQHASGNVYTWIATPDEFEIADPPEAVVSLIERHMAGSNGKAKAKVKPGAVGVREGGRTFALWSLAGRYFRMGLHYNEALELCKLWNLQNIPPLSPRAVEDKVRGIWEKHQRTYGEVVEPNLTRAADTLQQPIVLADPIVEGLIRKGEVVNLIGATKMNKSHMVMDLAISIATGTKWMGRFDVQQGPVVLLDNELHTNTLRWRLNELTKAKGLRPEDLGDLHFDCLRGRICGIDMMDRYFEMVAELNPLAIICDAMYRFLPAGISENDNAAITQLYNGLDRNAMRTNSALIGVMHSTKGGQSDKATTDVGAGAGAFSRAADTHLVVRRHEQDNLFVLDAAVRSFAPLDQMTLEWRYPLFSISEIEPVLRGATSIREGKRFKRTEAIKSQMPGVLKHKGPMTKSALADALGVDRRTIQGLILEGIEDGIFCEVKFKVRGKTVDGIQLVSSA